jgi:4-aminobutyrate aminotransferase-like enzyme
MRRFQHFIVMWLDRNMRGWTFFGHESDIRMNAPLQLPGEKESNQVREGLTRCEPRSLRTYTPTQAVLARSSGVFHWTAEGRRLFDFTSGVLVTNLGHNPVRWIERLFGHMGWPFKGHNTPNGDSPALPFFSALPMNAYNAVTPLEIEASRRLIALLQSYPGGSRLQQVMWAASGSEAIQKALWAALLREPSRDMIVATRRGFHGKKGLAHAVSGCETDHDRDPRVRFISFPMAECDDVSKRGAGFDPGPYRKELEALLHQFGRRIGVLITEPYLGGGGSYHPPPAYLQLLQRFCRENDVVFILDEVQSNFGRTGSLFAFETYGIEPDIVVLGKGLANGVPVAAAVGPADLFGSLDYGEASDTWSANPLGCAGVLATLEEFAAGDVLGRSRRVSSVVEAGLLRLKKLPFIAHVRGEHGGMVWGVETCDHASQTAAEWANAMVLACYHGDPASGDGIHLLGPLANKVIRVAPPLVLTEQEAQESLALMNNVLARCV